MTGTATVPSVEASQAALVAAFGGDNLPAGHQSGPSPTPDDNYGAFGAPAGQQEYEGQPQGQQGAPSQEQGGDQGLVPSFRLREATERARTAETQSQQLLAALNQQAAQIAELRGFVQGAAQGQQPAPAAAPDFQIPDVIQDPLGYARTIQAVVRQVAESTIVGMLGQARGEIVNLKLDMSDSIAEAVYGRDLIKAATHAAVAAGLKDSFMARPNPVVAACQWYQTQVTTQKYGGSPDAVRQAVFQELLQDPNALAQLVASAQGKPPQQRAPAGQQPPTNPPRLPPSFGGVPRTGTLPAAPPPDTKASLATMFDQRKNARLGVDQGQRQTA